jgi:hypothetical protein
MERKLKFIGNKSTDIGGMKIRDKRRRKKAMK